MLFTEDHDVIKTVSPDGSDDPFRKPHLPRWSSWDRVIAYANGSEAMKASP